MRVLVVLGQTRAWLFDSGCALFTRIAASPASPGCSFQFGTPASTALAALHARSEPGDRRIVRYMIARQPWGRRRTLSQISLPLAQVEKAGPFMHVGYGNDRPFLPSVVRDCWVGGLNEQTLMYRCLTNSGFSGAPILMQIDGTYSVTGIGSGSNHKMRQGYACSASQFEKVVADLLKSE
jgi:hypothetical protein